MVMMLVYPKGTVSVAEYKSIDRHKVFIVTAVGSIFAYVTHSSIHFVR